MSRNGAGVYSKPGGTTAVTATPILASTFNTLIDDIAADLNIARPIVAGGTGAATAAAARTALAVPGSAANDTISGAWTFSANPTVSSVDAGATEGPEWIAYRNSASPAVADLLGVLTLAGNNSAIAQTKFAQIVGLIVDPTGGSEDGGMGFYVIRQGTRVEGMRIISPNALAAPRVGINTGTPQYVLDVNGNVGASSLLANSASGNGVGYDTGAGNSVTQVTSRTTGVTINTPCGRVVMFTAAGSTTAATFTVNNSTILATDTIILNQRGGANKYNFLVTNVLGGSFDVTFFTTGGTASDTPGISFAVIKAVTA